MLVSFFRIIILYSRFLDYIILRYCSLGSNHIASYRDINSILLMLTVDAECQDRSYSLNLPIIVLQKVGYEVML